VVRQKIYDRAIAAMEKRQEFNRQRADALRGGTYYKPPKGAPGATPAPAAGAHPDPLGIL
jgi:hypothetical protein